MRERKTSPKMAWMGVAVLAAALSLAALVGLGSKQDGETPPGGESVQSIETDTVMVDMQGLQLELTPNWMPAGEELSGRPYTTMVDSLSCPDINHTDCGRLTVIDLDTFEIEQGHSYGPSEGQECYQYNPALEGTFYGGEERVEESTIAGLPAVHFTYAACEVDELTMSPSLPDSPDSSTEMDVWLIDERYAVAEFNVDASLVEEILAGAHVTE